MAIDFGPILRQQDGLLTRKQTLEQLSVGALRHRLGSTWRIVLPGVYAAFTGKLTTRQRLRAALLYAGPRALLSDVTALRAYGVQYLPPDPNVHLLIPATAHRASHGFAVVRRTHRPPRPRIVDGFPCCPPERAAVEAAARLGDQRLARAIMADIVQRRIGDIGRLASELPHITGRGSGIVRRAIGDILAGARSSPEVDFVELCKNEPGLPMPLLNPLLELPGGRRISPDALFLDAGLVHETNGRGPHSSDNRFEDMQSRHDLMTAAGLVVLHNPPRRLNLEGKQVMAEVVACYQRHARRGLPDGIVILRQAAA
jgi:hypothetical protein